MTVAQKRAYRTGVMAIFVVGILLPPLYLLVMVQYGARLFPYWDHMATAKQIVEYFDGTLTFKSMIETQSQARPFFPRLIFIANAALTKWDIRSEYTFIYMTVYGVLAAMLFSLWRLSRGWPRSLVLIAALLISLIACSPVGAMNYYWSLMLIATLSYLCAIGAFLIVAAQPRAWLANITAAILAWMATYSISQGLFVFPIVLLLQQAISPRPWSPNRWSVFWLVNLVACYLLYFPGLTDDLALPVRPAIKDFIGFVIVYLGSPLGSLLWFPDMGAILLPETLVINFICGLLLLGLTGVTIRRVVAELPARRTETLIFLCFAAYAGASALVTAFGRANGEFPVAVANSSRYSIFSACLLFGLIFHYAGKYARGELRFTRWHRAAVFLLVVAASVSYVRGIAVYKSTHDDNEWLANVYDSFAQPTDLDRRAYPDKSYFDPLRSDLLRLGIGPYRSVALTTKAIYKGPFVDAVPLTPGSIVTQPIVLAYPVLQSVSFQIVTWGKLQDSYRVQWKVVGTKTGTVIGKGSFTTSQLSDWSNLTLRMNGSSTDTEIEAMFSVDSATAVANPIGLALYQPSGDAGGGVLVNGTARENKTSVGMSANYRR